MLNLFNSEPKHLTPKDGEFIYYPDYFEHSESENYYKFLLNKIPWQQDTINMYGKEHPLPRKTAWYGNAGKSYTYSGIKMDPHDWNAELLSIKNKIEETAKIQFNSLLLNLYENGNHNVAWHADDEKELGNEVIIASVSFGHTRDFQLKHKTDSEVERITLPLEHGSLLLMLPPTQKYWLHQIPKRKNVLDPRINLTFRIIIE